jgi:hypothetical protein
MAFVLRLVSWLLLAACLVAALYWPLALWAINAESLGAHDAGLAIFLSFSAAWALAALFAIFPVALLLAAAIRLSRRASPLPALLAAAISGAVLAIAALA